MESCEFRRTIKDLLDAKIDGGFWSLSLRLTKIPLPQKTKADSKSEL
jgi:hypothetical protein